MENKLNIIENEVKELRLALDEALTLTKEQMILIKRQEDIIKSLESINKREEDMVKIMNYLVWKLECMDSRSFNGGVMSNMFAGMLMGG